MYRIRNEEVRRKCVSELSIILENECVASFQFTNLLRHRGLLLQID